MEKPEGESVRELLARADKHLSASRYREALELCDAALSAKPDEYDGYRLRGYAHEGLGNPDEALADAEQMMRLRADETSFFLRGERLLEVSRPRDALADFERVIALESESGDAYLTSTARLLSALCLLRLKRFRDARDACEGLADGTRWWALGSLYTKERILELAKH